MKTFVCPNCKRKLNKKCLYKHGMCIDCFNNPQKYCNPEPAIPTPKKASEETFVCWNCKRRLNKLYKAGESGVCTRCYGINPQRYHKPEFTVCSSCGIPVDTRYAVSNACFHYCKECAQKYSISQQSRYSKAGHLIVLFEKEEIPYKVTSNVCIETVSGKPCIEEDRVMGGVGIFSEISYFEISFPQLKEIAKNVSEELYEKYKGMNETNWLEYMYKYHNSNIYKFNVGAKFLKDAPKQPTSGGQK